MPTPVKKLSAEDLEKRRGNSTPSIDVLQPYLEMLNDIAIGEGLEVDLDEGEEQRTVKRRFTSAGKIQGKRINWRSSPKGKLVLQVKELKATPADTSSSGNGRRGRKKKEETSA